MVVNGLVMVSEGNTLTKSMALNYYYIQVM